MSTRLSNFMPPPAAAPSGGAAPQAFAAEVPLSKVLITHQGEVRVLQLRVPAYGDLIDIGEIDRVYVLEVDPLTNEPKKLETTVDRSVVMRWAERLTGYDPIVLGQLTLKDGVALETAIRKIIAAAQKGN